MSPSWVRLGNFFSEKSRRAKLEDEYRKQGTPEPVRDAQVRDKSVVPKANHRIAKRRRNTGKSTSKAKTPASRDSSEEPQPRRKRILRSYQRKRAHSESDTHPEDSEAEAREPRAGNAAAATAARVEDAAANQPEHPDRQPSVASSGRTRTSLAKRPFDQVNEGAEVFGGVSFKKRTAPDGSKEQELTIPLSCFQNHDVLTFVRDFTRE